MTTRDLTKRFVEQRAEIKVREAQQVGHLTILSPSPLYSSYLLVELINGHALEL